LRSHRAQRRRSGRLGREAPWRGREVSGAGLSARRHARGVDRGAEPRGHRARRGRVGRRAAPPTASTSPSQSAGRIAEARARFARDPFARWLGIEIADVVPDRAALVLPHRAEHMNAGGVLSGGASVSLLINAGTLAAWTGITLDGSSRLGCVDAAIHYLAAASEVDITADARVLRRGRHPAFLHPPPPSPHGT